METRRWMNHSLPQSLNNAVLLLYISAGFDAVLGGYLLAPLGVIIVAAKVGAGFGIANEQKWGYKLGIGVAAVMIVGTLTGVLPGGLIGLLFDGILLALLLHEQSREHQRIWFS
jgi:hypothetical protein